jgi:hypothetical protein
MPLVTRPRPGPGLSAGLVSIALALASLGPGPFAAAQEAQEAPAVPPGDALNAAPAADTVAPIEPVPLGDAIVEDAPAEDPLPEDAPIKDAATADTTIYVIRRIDFVTTGRSRPFALRYHGKLREGEELTGAGALNSYIQDRTQRLINQRVLENDVSITPTLGEPEPDGKVPVDLLVSVNDTWNIMVFPKPLWDSNEGFDLTLKARDYNFFGTMSPLRVDLGYQLNTRNESNFVFLLDTDIPFTALGYNWNLNFDNQFDYSWQEALGYTNISGISMELPWRRSIFNFDATHRLEWYAKNNEREQDLGYGKFFEGLLNSISFGITWEIPTGLEVYTFGELTYTPQIRQSFNYNPGSWDMYEWQNLRESYSTSLNQSLGFGRIDWIGNFRRGLSASFTNRNNYDYVRRVWNNSYSFDVIAHALFSGFFGITSRVQLRHWFNRFPDTLYYEAGDVLRGILNDTLWADMMLSANLEFPFRVLRARPSEWFNVPKLRIFNFELFVSPIIDFGLVHLPGPRNRQDTLGAYGTGGIELLIFPDIMRSLYLRLSYGINLGTLFKNGDLPPSAENEFFIGLEHFF